MTCLYFKEKDEKPKCTVSEPRISKSKKDKVGLQYF